MARKPASGQRTVQKKTGRAVNRLTVVLPVETAKRLGHYCIDAERSMSDVIDEAVRRYLDKVE